MGKVERGSFSLGSNTTATVILNDATLTPTEVEFFVGPAGTSDSTNHTCHGFMSATQNQCLSHFSDSTGSKSQLLNTKCIVHMTRVSGTITDKLVANRPTNPFRAGEFDITCTTNDNSFPIFFIARQY